VPETFGFKLQGTGIRDSSPEGFGFAGLSSLIPIFFGI
jgi:hypothetical protein